MKIVHISKGHGRFRTVYIPTVTQRAQMRSLARNVIAPLALKICDLGIVHGFMPGRSCVTNALMHVGYDQTMSCDLQDFFDHCTQEMLVRVMPGANEGFWPDLFPDGAARQGLPTSPIVANICFSPVDRRIRFAIPREVMYTRYADDLTFSAHRSCDLKAVLATVTEICTHAGFPVNARKTKFQDARNGRRIICGVAVDNAVHPTRHTKRKLRAARHRGYWLRAKGLAEWADTRLPKEFLKEETQILRPGPYPF